jgi:hypothetical protein
MHFKIRHFKKKSKGEKKMITRTPLQESYMKTSQMLAQVKAGQMSDKFFSEKMRKSVGTAMEHSAGCNRKIQGAPEVQASKLQQQAEGHKSVAKNIIESLHVIADTNPVFGRFRDLVTELTYKHGLVPRPASEIRNDLGDKVTLVGSSK